MKINFKEVSITAYAKNKNGKRRQKKFWQTLNPFNKNESGSPKTREEILVELQVDANNWKQEIAKSEE
mgnify:CR=1 FL=1